MNWNQARKKLAVGDEVKVEWIDAESSDPWFSKDEPFCEHGHLCITIGVIHSISEEGLVVYGTYSPECCEASPEEFCMTFKIPAGCIRKIHTKPRWGTAHELF
ncbi:hypothetical protein LCGC14_1057780 [marine sediment metagenome]|uniref:Uncharacterized protein n=1 Tax=marine sediment metagenome TaxID=412755 RepID=A0A0F9MM51_9ZZZZ